MQDDHTSPPHSVNRDNAPSRKLEGPFAPIPNWLMRRREISPGAKLFYGRLLQQRGLRNPAPLRLSDLAGELGVSEKQAGRYKEELKGHRLIGSDRTSCKAALDYDLPPHHWQNSDQTDMSGQNDHTDTSGQTGHKCPVKSADDRTDMSGPIYRRNKEKKGERKRECFCPPKLEEIKAECQHIGLREIEGEKFFYHYEGNGWQRVTDWRSRLQKWRLNAIEFTPAAAVRRENSDTHTARWAAFLSAHPTIERTSFRYAMDFIKTKFREWDKQTQLRA